MSQAVKYDIIVISDLHWGVKDEDMMTEQYTFILDFIENYPVDLIVIAGDYFDFKLNLDSDRTVRALDWFDELFHVAQDNNVKKIRMLRGTLSHDAYQMNAFKRYEEDDEFFRIYETCTSEETLPGLRCVYCPDEIMNTKDYIFTYMDQLFSNNQVGFFHGSFDVVLQEDYDLNRLLKKDDDMTVINSITFPFSLFKKIVDYVWVGGHWHDGESYDNVYYSGSVTRWRHNEDNPKGFGFLRVDLESQSYFYTKIENTIAPKYLTYELHSDDLNDSSDNIVHHLIDEIETQINFFIKNDEIYDIRVMIYETEKTVSSDTAIHLLREHFASVPHVSVRVKSKAKQKKKDKTENTVDLSFARNESIDLSKRIQEFILKTKGEEIPLEYIEQKINKYKK